MYAARARSASFGLRPLLWPVIVAYQRMICERSNGLCSKTEYLDYFVWNFFQHHYSQSASYRKKLHTRP